MFSLLGAWLLLGCLDMVAISWDMPHSLRDQVKLHLFHWRGGILPSGLLPLYVPFLLGIYLVRRGRGDFIPIVTVSILLRFVLLPSWPILESDPYRYLWDGRMVGIGQNPFEYSPAEVTRGLVATEEELAPNLKGVVEEIGDDELYREILSHINNKDVPTIYMPTTQAAFGVADLLVRTTLRAWPENADTDWSHRSKWAIVVWKAFLLPFEIGILWLIVGLLKRLSLNRSWVVVYGWSPLILKEYSNTGHFDPIVIFLVLMVLRVLLSPPMCRMSAFLSRRFRAGVIFGLAIGCKVFPALLVPLALKRVRFAGAVGIGVTLVLLFLPFLGVRGRVLEGFATYSDRWENNSSVVSALEWTFVGLGRMFGPPLRRS